MFNGNTRDFIEHTFYEECAVMFRGRKYFFHGVVFTEYNQKYSYDIDLWDENGCFVCSVFNASADSEIEILQIFYEARIWDNQTFWDVESEMTWIDW